MNIREVLGHCPLFAGAAEADLDDLAASTRVRSVASGETLLAIGMPADHLYILAAGRMRVELADGTLVSDIGRLEPIGEMSLLSSESRTATVFAVRDSKVLEIGRAALDEIFQSHPNVLLAMSRTIISRLRQNHRVATLAASRRSRCFALLAAGPEIDLSQFAKDFAAALRPNGEAQVIGVERVDEALGEGSAHTPKGEGGREDALINWLQELEFDHRHLVYIGGTEAGPWARRCSRQADRILVLADASLPPEASPAISELLASGLRTAVDLILIRPEGAPAGKVMAWRQMVGAQSHFFYRPGHEQDVARIARSLTGRGIGLVLGGGGARGFAHIGLLRALEELKIDIDVYGGTSMGGFIGALAARGHSSAEVLEIMRESFVSNNFLNDYILPKVSLIRGRKFRRRLKEIFEDQQIEDLRVPFFCVSTNLTQGCTMTHEDGPLGLWVGASMCVPGIAPPMAYRGDLLVDGAVINSLPTDVMQDLQRGLIIASDVSTEGELRAPGVEGPDPEVLLRWKSTEKRPSLFSILFRTATLTSGSGVAARAALADLYLHMPVGSVGIFEWKQIDELVDIGYRYAMEKLPELIAKQN